MNYRIFQYALPAPPELDDLNAFLASERVASAVHHVVDAPGGPMLVFVVQTAGRRAAPAVRCEPRIDYRATLPPEEFALFSRLRDERKKIAEAEGVPVYTIFSNAQLAEMVRRRAQSPADLLAIDGVGEARTARYGDRMIAHLVTASPVARET